MALDPRNHPPSHDGDGHGCPAYRPRGSGRHLLLPLRRLPCLLHAGGLRPARGWLGAHQEHKEHPPQEPARCLHGCHRVVGVGICSGGEAAPATPRAISARPIIDPPSPALSFTRPNSPLFRSTRRARPATSSSAARTRPGVSLPPASSASPRRGGRRIPRAKTSRPGSSSTCSPPPPRPSSRAPSPSALSWART